MRSRPTDTRPGHLSALPGLQPVKALLMVLVESHNVLHQARKPVNGTVEPVTPFLSPLRHRFNILGAFPHGGIGNAYGFRVLLHQPHKAIVPLFKSGTHRASILLPAATFI